MKKYFHEATKEELDAIPNGTAWTQVAEDYPQPKWCRYPDAVAGMMGCWSLMAGYVTDEEYCKGCDCYAKATNKS